jgi:thioesterase domain-containing protein
MTTGDSSVGREPSRPAPAPVPLTPSGSRTPIFGVHNGAGSAYPYVPLASRLGPDQPFYAFQQYELDRHHEPPSSVEAIAESYVDAVRALRPTGPYVFAGMCSTGAYIAYEMARQVRAAGGEVRLVVLIDPADSEVDRECSRSHELVERALGFASSMDGLSGTDARRPALRGELARLVSALGLPPGLLELGPRRLAGFLALFAANHQASMAYTPLPYPGRTALFVPVLSRGDDRLLTAAEWEALVPGIAVYPLSTERGGLYSAPRIVAQIGAAIEAALC